MNFKIEKNIAVPPMPNRGPYNIYPWKEMEVGDSFLLVPKDGESLRGLMRRINPQALNAKKRLGRTFTCRTVENGVRVWRVA